MTLKKTKRSKTFINIKIKHFYFARGFLFLMILCYSSAWALSSDGQQPYYVTADKAIYDRNQHITTYIGNVQVIQGSSQLLGDKAILYQDDKNFITHVVAFGNFAHYSTLPEPGKDRMHALARSIDYNPSDRIVWLIGDGHVNEGGEFFSGPHIWYDMSNGLVRSSPRETEGMPPASTSPNANALASPNGQRTVIILPGNKNKHIPPQMSATYIPTPATAVETIVPRKKSAAITTNSSSNNPAAINNAPSIEQSQ